MIAHRSARSGPEHDRDRGQQLFAKDSQLKAKFGVKTLPDLMRLAIEHLPTITRAGYAVLDAKPRVKVEQNEA